MRFLAGPKLSCGSERHIGQSSVSRIIAVTALAVREPASRVLGAAKMNPRPGSGTAARVSVRRSHGVSKPNANQSQGDGKKSNNTNLR